METKKEWTKMSRNLKKQGINHTCVMNAKQQKLGTATIMFAYVMDRDVLIRNTIEFMNDERGIKAEAMHYYEHMNRCREAYDNLFLPRARKEGDEDYLNTLLADCEAYDNGTYLEYAYDKAKKNREKRGTANIERYKTYKPLTQQVEEANEQYGELINNKAVREFMEATGATVEMEIKPDGPASTMFYARFHY